MSEPRLPPGPRPWPLLGHLPELRREGLLPFLERQWRQHGDVFSMDLNGPTTVIAHPEAIQRVLLTHSSNYVKGSLYDGVRRVIGDGVLTMEGSAWKARRALLQPTFHRSSLAILAGIMAERGQRFFDAWLDQHGAASFEIDAHRQMVELTLDVVVAALFGQTGGADVSYEALGAALELVSEHANGFSLPEWVPTPRNRKFQRTLRALDSAVYKVIAAGRARPQEGTLLAMLLDARDAETGAPLTDREVRDEVLTLFVAGHETTALTLTWLWTLLAQHPEVLARMQAEVDTTLGGRDPGFEDVARLPYLRMVIDETLRLRGPVAMIARNVLADDEIMGFQVRAGTSVMPFFYAVHRHPDYWEDPQRFDPERFSPERSKGRNLWSYLPFSHGKRRCIGDQFSLIETVLLLAQLLRRFEVTIDPSAASVAPNLIATVRPSGPVRVRLRARAANLGGADGAAERSA